MVNPGESSQPSPLRVALAWLRSRRAAPPPPPGDAPDDATDAAPGAEESPPDEKGDEVPSAPGKDSPPESDEAPKGDEDSEEDLSSEDLFELETQEELEKLRPFHLLSQAYAKRIEGLGLPQTQFSTTLDPKTRELTTKSVTPAGKETHFTLTSLNGDIQIKTRDYDPQGLLGDTRPYDGDDITPEVLDVLMDLFYQSWQSRIISPFYQA